MKKKLESELISLAHRVLKLTGREDLKKMQEEVALLYQKITILKFFQDQFKGEIPEELEAKTSFFSSLDGAFNNKVSDSVEIISKSYKKSSPAIHWSCDGSPEFNLVKSDKKNRGTEIILNISKDSKSFLEDNTIGDLLKKYNRFMPIPIKFGTKEVSKKEGEGKKEKEIKETVDNIINITEPAWTKNPKDLKEEDYKTFYKDLYPMNFEDPLFNIHLNVDYPFNLTGILYFPKITNDINLQKDKIQLFQNQVFVTDNVEGIVPEFLTLLRGVIDSPDIPLNVSRSYLQVDSAVKKISNYITRKVADKLNSLFKKDRKKFEDKWAFKMQES